MLLITGRHVTISRHSTLLDRTQSEYIIRKLMFLNCCHFVVVFVVVVVVVVDAADGVGYR